MNVPVSGKVIYPEDKQALADLVLSDADPTYGKYNQLFETEFANYIGVRHAHFVNSGSSANLLAFAAFASPNMYKGWRIKSGDEIITIAASFPTTITPILQYKCIPVFVDIDNTHNINTDLLEKALTKKTKGVFIAHTLGNPFHIPTVLDFCRRHGLFLIEDSCDALGSKFNGRFCGSFGDVSTFSFYPAHHMTTFEGGMVTTSDDTISTIVRSLSAWGKNCFCSPGKDNACGKRFTGQFGELPVGYDHKYVFEEIGYNLQATQLQALMGYRQLQHLDEFTEKRHENFNYLHLRLEELSFTQIQLPRKYALSDPSWFGFPILLNPDKYDRRKVTEELTLRGVQNRLLFAGNITKQPMFTKSKYPYRVVGDLTMTDKIMNNLFWIGSYHGLSAEQMKYSADTIMEVLG